MYRKTNSVFTRQHWPTLKKTTKHNPHVSIVTAHLFGNALNRFYNSKEKLILNQLFKSNTVRMDNKMQKHVDFIEDINSKYSTYECDLEQRLKSL